MASDYDLSQYGSLNWTGAGCAGYVPTVAIPQHLNEPNYHPSTPFLAMSTTSMMTQAPSTIISNGIPAPVHSGSVVGLDNVITQASPTCANCGSTFTRVADLERLYKKYQSGPKEFQWVEV